MMAISRQQMAVLATQTRGGARLANPWSDAAPTV